MHRYRLTSSMDISSTPVTPASTATAAESLLGLTLEGGWTVTQRLARDAGATGGTFSVGYLAERNGERAFVKALDYAKAFGSAQGTTPEILQYMTAAFTFEKAVLERCREKKMRRVTLPIASGSLDVPTASPMSRVDYMILEVADRDVRAHIDASTNFDAAWRVRTLHQATVALRQLHAELIAHQDVKPSNFLIFRQHGAKITDLGRSSRQGYSSPHDQLCCAGDKGYSAPELLYGYELQDWRRRRIGNDVFMLGSLVYFFFAGTSLPAAMISFLHPSHVPRKWGGDYAGVLPYLRDAFDRALVGFTAAAENVVSPSLARDLTVLVRELCEPDPSLRGDPKYLGTPRDPLSLERYVTRFNVIAARLEMRLQSDAPATRR
jgi:serine/threonine protein kinase